MATFSMLIGTRKMFGDHVYEKSGAEQHLVVTFCFCVLVFVYEILEKIVKGSESLKKIVDGVEVATFSMFWLGHEDHFNEESDAEQLSIETFFLYPAVLEMFEKKFGRLNFRKKLTEEVEVETFRMFVRTCKKSGEWRIWCRTTCA